MPPKHEWEWSEQSESTETQFKSNAKIAVSDYIVFKEEAINMKEAVIKYICSDIDFIIIVSVAVIIVLSIKILEMNWKHFLKTRSFAGPWALDPEITLRVWLRVQLLNVSGHFPQKYSERIYISDSFFCGHLGLYLWIWALQVG